MEYEQFSYGTQRKVKISIRALTLNQIVLAYFQLLLNFKTVSVPVGQPVK